MRKHKKYIAAGLLGALPALGLFHASAAMSTTPSDTVSGIVLDVPTDYEGLPDPGLLDDNDPDPPEEYDLSRSPELEAWLAEG